jgi:hypothetical protein
MQYLPYVLFIISLSCTYHSISAPELLNQGKQFGERFYIVEDSLAGYDISKITKITCTNEDGEKVRIAIDGNTQLQVLSNSLETYKMRFRSLIIYKDTLYGERSIFLGLPSKIALRDIKEIKIYSEFVSEEKVK